MNAVRRTTIRIEKHELKVIRVSGSALHFCESCGTETQHLPIAQMATLLMVSERKLFRMAEFEIIHSAETVAGKLLICTHSAINLLNM
jgi:hypothetical protein